MNINNILLEPRVTEKSLDSAKNNVYSFYVNRKANKHQVREVVENLYGVEVSHVRTILRKGKIKRVGRRGKEKKHPDRKIAYITLKKGRIDIFPS
jgi:large subunit ribosomal protein L23